MGTRLVIRPFPWPFLLLSAGSAVVPAAAAVWGQWDDWVWRFAGLALLGLVMAMMWWAGDRLEVTGSHVRRWGKGLAEVPRDRIAGIERHGPRSRLFTHDGAELWLGWEWSARGMRRLARELGLPEPVKVTVGQVRLVLRDWPGVAGMSVLATAAAILVAVLAAMFGGWSADLLLVPVTIAAPVAVMLAAFEFFSPVVIGDQGVRTGGNRVVVRRAAIREVVRVRNTSYLRDDADRWFAIGKPTRVADRLAAALDVPIRVADKVDGRLVE